MRDSKTQRICLWSGPRNVSTALLYSFAQRDDTQVVDEPLYAHYLRVSGAVHPGGDAVLAAQDQDGDRVIREVVLSPCDRPRRFVKHMAHHLLGLDRAFLAEVVNVLLVRDPCEMLPSLVNQIPEPTLGDTGLAVQTELYDQLRELGQDPVVLDAKQLLLDPEGVLRQLCARLEMRFESGMLEWEAGSRSEDGVWAPHWYQSVHLSTSFAPYCAKATPFPERLRSLLEECRLHYERLEALALRA